MNFQITYYVEYQLPKVFLSLPTEAMRGFQGDNAHPNPTFSTFQHDKNAPSRNVALVNNSETHFLIWKGMLFMSSMEATNFKIFPAVVGRDFLSKQVV